MSPAYDLITVGGGLGGAALAKAMAERGARVLVIERERQFRDRVRGEVLLPWGVVEAHALGIYDLLRAACGHDLRWWNTSSGPITLVQRDIVATTPAGLPMLAFFHPAMQEALLQAAVDAGAEVRRGARVRGVTPGTPAKVAVEADGRSAEEVARLVVGVDGRASLVRQWGGFAVHRDPDHLLMSGILLEDVDAPADTAQWVVDPFNGRGALLFPQGGERARAYLTHQRTENQRLQGADDVPRFLAALVEVGAPPEHYRRARAAGPLATFDCADTWVPHPYRDGVALVGDAASSSDPTWGQGLSLTLRDVRVLRDHLVATADWDAAGHAYAAEHDRHYGTTHLVDGWTAELFYRLGPEGDARRAEALPRLALDQTRIPDHAFSGPDLPADDDVRRRFFGEA